MAFNDSRVSSRYNSQKQTKKAKFLNEMNKIMPWDEIVEEISKVVSEKVGSKGGRPPYGNLLLIKTLCLGEWFGISDDSLDDEIHERLSFQQFLDINPECDAIPEKTTIWRFRNKLVEAGLFDKIFEIMNKKLDEKGLICKTGTIVDATIIQAPSSTKNKEGKRDPEMHSTFKRKTPYFGMKCHIGTDIENGIVHTVKVTAANVHDINMVDKLQHGAEKTIMGDSGYSSEKKEKKYLKEGKHYITCRRGSRGHPLTDEDKSWNKIVSRVRMKVERPFGVIKCLWKHTKLRYKGLKKNAAEWTFLFGLANLYRMRKYFLDS